MVRFADKESHQVFLEPESWGVPRDVRAGPLHQPSRGSADRTGPHPFRGWRRPSSCGRGYAIEYDYIAQHAAEAQPGDQAGSGPLLRRADQRYVGLRGGGRPGVNRRDQRRLLRGGTGAPGDQPLGGVHRRADRRPGDQRLAGAVPDADLPGRVPDDAPAGDAHLRLTEKGREYGLVDDARWEVFVASGTASRRSGSGWPGPWWVRRRRCSGCWSGWARRP